MYGNKLANGSWTGVVGLLHRREIDLTFNDLAITEARSQVLDFALGIFKDSGALFMQKPRHQSISW